MPLVVFLFLVLLLVMLVGIACACLTENPMQAIERVLTVLAQLPAVPVAWSLALSTLLLLTAPAGVQSAGRGRASPAALQRFRF